MIENSGGGKILEPSDFTSTGSWAQYCREIKNLKLRPIVKEPLTEQELAELRVRETKKKERSNQQNLNRLNKDKYNAELELEHYKTILMYARTILIIGALLLAGGLFLITTPLLWVLPTILIVLGVVGCITGMTVTYDCMTNKNQNNNLRKSVRMADQALDDFLLNQGWDD